ncbi:MAG: hypothetical protein RLZZ293_189 [Pseudomonadota bacterium]|jgi:CRISPR-associated protein Csm4
MLLYKVVVETTSHFVTPLKGDTLFGHFCWAYRERHGKSQLEQVLLAGYTNNQPKIIFSDAYNHDYLFLPKYIYDRFGFSYDATKRKEIKARKYLPLTTLLNPKMSLKKIWQNTVEQSAQDSACNAKEAQIATLINFAQTHNTINRVLGTTSSGIFAPYNTEVFTYKRFMPLNDKNYNKQDNNLPIKLDIYIMLNEDFFQQLGQNSLVELINDIGTHGFGADASIGKGKFTLSEIKPIDLNYSGVKSGFTLAPAIIDATQDKITDQFYDVFTRFGRHGNIMAHSQQVFKQPVTMMNSNAFILFQDQAQPFIGNGLINSQCSINNETHIGYVQAYSMIIPLAVD